MRSPPSLARVLAPFAPGRFLADVWGEKPLHVRGAPRKFAGLFGWRALNDLLATQRLEPPRLRLAMEGASAADLRSFLQYRLNREEQRTARLDVHRLNSRLARGATLVLNEVQEMHPPLGALTREFARLFVAEPNVNLYASFGRRPGFGPHWDDHDVFVLQLAGEKRWLIYGPSRRHPLHRDVRPNEMQPVRPVARYRLHPGDLLYIPRGHWHDAIAVGEPTLHLTLGISPLTAVDYLTWVADDLRAVESMRRDLPLFDDKRREEWHRTLNAAVLPRLNEKTLKRFLEGRRARLDASTRPALPHAIAGTTRLGNGDRLQWTGSTGTAHRDAAGLTVRSGGREYVFDPAAAPLIERLLSGKAVSYGRLLRSFGRQLGAGRLRRFVGELLREHFVTIV
ncbi:MAG TPA: cupin domain-containing protein [Steroidobacteraceae bacterium]|nr:cupin domain-containing protein [Steroidobacteraceae bacterium]